ncbi:MAG: trans-2,3-dihydro-3-hydroxyanthranilate isomerase [Acidimicrobiaceae bacterium]|jgi:trans-2,3-dihydro-3-hydroxyanthranilate isomerase
MELDYVIADVFTDTALTGNQLAVFVDGDAVPPELMQPLAREIGFSETTYVGAGDRIRIFTPGTELPFAGHPVLGTAFVLAQHRGVEHVDLITGLGPVPVHFDGRGRGTMAQPIPTVAPWGGDVAALCAALGVPGSDLPVDEYVNGPHNVYVSLGDPAEVAALRPDLGRLATLGPWNVSCFAGSGTDWKSRMFAPGIGVAEDPATGSAAGPLAVHLARHGRIAWGKQITITQGGEMLRPSTLYATAHGSDTAVSKVEVAGDTVVVGRGTFEL